MKPEEIKDLKTGIKVIEDSMITKLLKYLNEGIFPKGNSQQFINAYSSIFILSDMQDNNYSEDLYNYYNDTIESYIKDCQKKLSQKSNKNLINSFIIYTNHISFFIYSMNRIFLYLEKYYIKNNNKMSLPKLGMNLYKKNFFDKFKINIFIEVNKLIREDRNNNKEFRNDIKCVMEILKYLDLPEPKIIKENNKILWSSDIPNKNELEYEDEWYNNYFEKDTIKFAKEKANNEINNMSVPEYVLSQLEYISEEKERQKIFINPKYHKKINTKNYKYLIGEVMNELVHMDTGIENMLKTKNEAQLANIYKLFKLYPDSLKEITEEFLPYIEAGGNAIYNDKEISTNPLIFIPVLISFKKQMDSLVINCFENNKTFQDVKNKAFSFIMEKKIYAKQLSIYVDYNMRYGFKGKSQNEIENVLNDVIDLFKCLNPKLVFQTELNKKMSERLIKNKSLSILIEKKFVSKLKQEAGVTYISKMQEMLNDLDKNKTNITNYKLLEHKGFPNKIKFEPLVISTSPWEISQKSMEKLEIPKFLKFCIDDFDQFYINKYQTHKLNWCLGLSKIEIEYLYLKSKYISISTLPQLLALLLLETHKKLTLETIAQLCGCHPSTIINDIQGLIYNPSFNPNSQFDKGIILGTFNPETKEFKESDEISINLDFKSTKVKFNTIPLPQKKSANEIKEEEIEEARITKRYQDNIIQATLTRIMKSRIGQKNTHMWLVNETFKQIELFKAQPQQIKENIEKLIEKNIIKRDEKDRTCYDYIA